MNTNNSLQPTTVRLKLLFTDRKQIVAQMAGIITSLDLNIFSMEVVNQGETTVIFLETSHSQQDPDHTTLMAALKEIPNLLGISTLATMPQETREKRFKVVLDSISDGIVSIDETGIITTINQVARTMLGLSDTDCVGKDIRTLAPGNHAILNCLEKKPFNNEKRNVITGTGRFQFFSSGRAVEDSSGRIIGAVEVMKDMREIKEMADEMTHPSELTFSDIIGNSPALMEAISFAQKIAPSASIVSIRGESGTGKELFAKAIHNESGLKGPFVPINCAALPESLLESELFGYEKGSFTGARTAGKPGLFEIADNGTLFLDEIAEMPPGSQAKILRAIQEKTVRRIGGIKEIPIHTRIITATSRPMEEMIKTGGFREDLYYRINVIPIHVPPLRERPEDIPLLVRHFLSRTAASQGRRARLLSNRSLEKLQGHTWPGNIRELKNVMERACLLSERNVIDDRDIIFGFNPRPGIQPLTDHPVPAESHETLRISLARQEKAIIRLALQRYPSIRKCATALGISHTTLLNKIKKHGIGDSFPYPVHRP
ncbi:MAG: sigma 54-interacting transcriptional regulator [Pseudomonadota bacterium]